MNGEILHLSAARVYGGGEEHLRVLLATLARRGWPVALASPPSAPLRERLSGAGVRLLDWGPFGPAAPRAVRDLLRLLRAGRFSLVHSHNPIEDLAAAAARWMLGVPSVSTVHDRLHMDGEGRRRRDLNARIHRAVLRWGFDVVLAVSEATRADVERYAGVPPHRLAAIANGVLFDRIDAAPPRDASRRRLGLPEGALAFGMSARVESLAHRKKGVDVFLAAARAVLEGRPRAHAWIVGLSERARAEALSLAGDGAWTARLHLEPFRGDLPTFLSAWDLAILPSRYEGLPRGMLEAMAAGLPVVASAIDGVAEALGTEAGVLVPAADAGGLSRGILALLDDPARRARAGEAARARARGRYGAERMAADVEHAYREILR